MTSLLVSEWPWVVRGLKKKEACYALLGMSQEVSKRLVSGL